MNLHPNLSDFKLWEIEQLLVSAFTFRAHSIMRGTGIVVLEFTLKLILRVIEKGILIAYCQ